MKMNVVMVSALLVAASLRSPAQVVVDNINLNEVEGLEHILLMCFWDGFFSQKLTIWVNYGQRNNKDSVVLEDGQPKQFASNITALNYFYERGWDLHETFLIERPNPVTGNRELMFYHFLRRKK